MNIPNDIFIAFTVFAFALGIIGIWLASKRVAGSPFIIVWAGIILFAQSALIENIEYFGIERDNIITHYDIQALTGQITIHNGTSNLVIRAERLTTSSSMLFGDTVNCMNIAVGKTGSPSISTPVILGVWSATTTNSIAEEKYRFGTINVTAITTDKTFFKRCNTALDYTLTTGDRVGLMYRSGDASNLISVNANIIDPFDGTVTILNNYNDASNTWQDTSNTDLAQMTLTLEKEATGQLYAFNQNDTWAFFVFFGLIFVIIGALVQFSKW